MNNQLHRYQIGRRCGLQAAFASKTSKKPASLLLLSLLYLLSGLPATAQQPQWLNPQPFGSDVNDIEFFDSLRGIQVGTFGAVAYTSDGGANWEVAAAQTSVALKQIARTGNQSAVVRADTFLLHTLDGGATWETLAQFDTVLIKKINFVDATHGFALMQLRSNPDENILATSTDGGATWQTTGNVIQQAVALAFHDPLNGIICTYSSGTSHILATANGGQTFGSVSQVGGKVEEAIAADDHEYFLAGTFSNSDCYGLKKTDGTAPPMVLHSTDDGFSWQNISPTGDFKSLKGIKTHVDNGSRMLMTWGEYTGEYTGVAPPVWQSADEGATWTKGIFPPLFDFKRGVAVTAVGIKTARRAEAYVVSFTNSRSGETRLPFSTTDGLTWQPDDNAFADGIYDMSMNETDECMATDGFIWTSAGNGFPWDTAYNASNPLPVQLISVDGSSNGMAMALYYDNLEMECHKVLTSVGGLTNWQMVADSQKVSPISMAWPAWDKAYKFGKPCKVLWKKEEADSGCQESYPKHCGKGRFYASHDQGHTWTEHPLPADTLNNMVFTGPLTGCIFGGGGTTPSGGYYRTTDGGLHWEFNPLGTAEVLKGTMVNDTTGFIITRDTLRQVYRFVRTAQGNTLKLLFTAPADEPVNDLAFSDDHQGYLLTLDTEGAATLHQTTDAGDTWQTWGPYAYLRNLKVFYNLNGFAWGDNGRLLQLANGYPVGTPSPAKAGTSLLTARAIPGTGQIEATIHTTATGQATLTLTDLTGRTLAHWPATLNGQPQTLRLPTRGLTPGMMVLSLETNGHRVACKVMVNP